MLMMIKRSNRGKLSGSLGGRALPDMRKGTQRKRRHPLPYALILVLGLVLSLGMVPAMAEAEEISGPPAHKKIASEINADGTVDVTLDVTGAVGQSSKSSKSDVIVVLDLSGSMNAVASPDKNGTYYTGETYNDGSKCEVKYSRRYSVWYYTRTGDSYNGSEFYSKTNETTRLDTAKSAVKSLVNKLLANNVSHPGSVNVSLVTFSDRATVKVGLTDKEATIDDAVKDLKAEGGTNWEDALKTAGNNIKTRDGASASVVFVSDGDPTLRNSTGYWDDRSHLTPYGLWGSGVDDPYGYNYGYALDQAKKIVGKKWELYSVAAFGNVNNMSNLVKDKDVYGEEKAEGHYFQANDSESLNAAFDNIVKSITTTVSYTDVSIHDSLSDSVEYFLPSSDAKEPTFTYMRNGEPWNDAPTAYLNKDGDVVWSVGDLEKDTIYSVTFKVQLKQEAYDAAAPMDGKDPVSEVKTNSGDPKRDFVEYSITTVVDNKPTTSGPHQSEYEPQTVKVPTSILHVSKTWVDKGWENVSKPSVKVQVMQDDHPYKTVMLNADAWDAKVVVAAGPRGHRYTVKEENVPEGWEATLDPKDGVELQGRTSLWREQAITNTLKTAKLTITKSVTGNFGDTSKDFRFTLTDASDKAITNVKAVEGTSDDVRLENNGSFTLKDGHKLVVELPYGATYKVFENEPKGTNDTVGYTTTIDAVGDATIDKDTQRTASSPEGGIKEDTTITYTNKRDVTPDVGVDLGSGAPYAAVFGGAGLAGVIWMVLKRRNSLGI